MDAPQRTHPRTFAVKAATMLTQLVIPIGVASVTILDDGDLGDLAVYFLPFVLLVIAANFAVAYLQWTRLTYAVRENDIRVESGLLSRAARSIPYERIQDVSLEQKLLPRLFGLVEAKFETGAGGGDDLKLAYLAEEEGDRLRELIRARRDGRSIAAELAEAPTEEASETLFAMPPRRVFTFGLFEFSLAAVAVLGGLAQQLEFLLPFELWDLDGWQERLAGPGQWLSGLGPLAKAAGIAIAIATLAWVGVTTGVVRTALREWDFRLERTEKGLRRRRGLLTRTDLVMPVHRVQALKLTTGFLRRRFGWYGLSVVSLASDKASSNHEAAPFAQIGEIVPIAAATGFALPPEGLDWKRRSPRASIDSALIEGSILLGVSALVFVFSPYAWNGLLPLVPGAIVALRQYYLYRFDRHALSGRFLYARHGWLAPRMMIGSRVKLQSVELAQGPLARRRGYADLRFGLAGGSFEIEGMELEDAQAWRQAVLESLSSTDFSEISGAAPDMEQSGA
ncbi:PH domain-containing protein [Qipengyuania sp. 6B39]|nr:PH domain-containing protein [Qipengyuania proteolytica]MBX7494526.1 PH domain-containing protein [Qipengyuania proteolytica]